MDQGWAALLAAIVGLVGALGGAAAGGYAAIRGAREGAERSAKAMLEQARQQAKDQFDHWLRQERRLVYADLLQEADDLLIKLAELANCRAEGTERAEVLEALLGFHEGYLTLIRRGGSLATVAHPGVLTIYQEVTEQCSHLFHRLQNARPPDVPWDQILEQFQRQTVSNAQLVAAVAVDIQAGPADRQGMR